MSELTLPVEKPESSIQLWANLAQSLQQGGFGVAGPEYLKLAKLVVSVRRAQLLAAAQSPSVDEPNWQKLSAIANSVFTLLDPLREASRMLAELPARIDALPTSALPESTAPPIHHPDAKQSAPVAVQTEPEPSTPKRRRTASKGKHRDRPETVASSPRVTAKRARTRHVDP
jgi:hypothetical protein